MKKITLLLIAGALATFASCEKDSTTPNTTTNPTTPTTPTTPEYFLKLKIDGQEFSAIAPTAHVYTNKDLMATGMITYKNQTCGATLSINNYDGVKLYSYDEIEIGITSETAGSNPFSFETEDNANNTIKVIEASSTSVKGEFSGKLTNTFDTTQTINVTNGTFHIKLI
jgi:hypothetical protein